MEGQEGKRRGRDEDPTGEARGEGRHQKKQEREGEGGMVDDLRADRKEQGPGKAQAEEVDRGAGQK